MAVFVGREEELQHLQRRLDEALAGKGRVVFVTGDAGAGKSSFCKRFLIDAALRVPEARVISGDCSEQYGAGEPYQPFVEAFRDLVTASDRPGGKARLRDLARELAPHWLAAIPVAGDVIAATAATAVELKEAMGGGGTATAAPPSEEALFFQYTELLLAAAQEHPVLLFLDDLHWADHASVSLLGHVARKISDMRVLIVGTYRPADVEVGKHPVKQAKLELERYGVAEELELPALQSHDFEELITEELGAPPTRELVDWLAEHAGSNPLFFSELLKWLVEAEIAVERYDAWTLARLPTEYEIPRSAESAIEKRLTRLDPELYRVLEYASVEGDEFDSGVLARLLDMDELELEEKIEPLVRVHGLIMRRETRDLPNGEITDLYGFSHSLVQDVLHRNVQGKRRILLHRKVAQILEEFYATDTKAVAHKLAIHYDEGRVADRAYEFARLAAENASRVYAHWEAIGLLQRALKNANTEPQKVEALDSLGDETRLVGRYAEALGRYGEALELAESLGDEHRQLVIERKRALVERDHGRMNAHELLKELERLSEKARALSANEELCRILWTLTTPLHETGGEPGARAELAGEALEIAKSLEKPELVARAHYILGSILVFSAAPADAIPHLKQALGFYEAVDQKDEVGQCRNGLAIVHTLLGDYGRAAEELNAATTAFDEIGHPAHEASARNNLGILLSRMGEWDRAEENLLEAARLFQRTEATVQLLHPLQNLAELYQAKGSLDVAREQWQRLVDRARETGYWNAEVAGRCGLGTVSLLQGDLSAAKSAMEEARELLEAEAGWSEGREACQLLAARVAAAEGDTGRAVKLLESAEEVLGERDRFMWATFRFAHAEILATEDPTAADPIVREALAAFEELGAGAMRARCEELLGELEKK